MRFERYKHRVADIALGMSRWWVTYCQGMVPLSIAQTVFDMVSGGPGPVGSGPAMQAVVRPVYEETLACTMPA